MGEMSDYRATVCAALLAADKPLSVRDFGQILDVSAEAIEREIAALDQFLRESNLGMQIDRAAGGYRLIIQPALLPALAPLLAPAALPQLSNAALETLAIIAYRQPLTRGEIELARGASSSSTLDTLQERGLIAVVGHRDVVGKPQLFGTTERFLLEFGLHSLADLPSVEEETKHFLRG